MQRQQPIEELLKRRSDVRVRLEALPTEIEQAYKEYTDALGHQRPWLLRLLLADPTADATVKTKSEAFYAVKMEQGKLKEEHSRLERAIKSAKEAKKAFLAAQIARNAADAQRRVEAEEHERFCNSAISNLEGEFDRKNFHIQPKDYSRGNAIDNYFRKIAATVFSAFNHCCVFCGTSHDLTFDHYGLSKNEGGNFALIMADKSIRLNIVVLCRGCNAAKAQRGHLIYFSDAQGACFVLSPSIA